MSESFRPLNIWFSNNFELDISGFKYIEWEAKCPIQRVSTPAHYFGRLYEPLDNPPRFYSYDKFLSCDLYKKLIWENARVQGSVCQFALRKPKSCKAVAKSSAMTQSTSQPYQFVHVKAARAVPVSHIAIPEFTVPIIPMTPKLKGHMPVPRNLLNKKYLALPSILKIFSVNPRLSLKDLMDPWSLSCSPSLKTDVVEAFVVVDSTSLF